MRWQKEEDKQLSIETEIEHPIEKNAADGEIWWAVHTPPPRPTNKTDCEISVMTALHTPLLGPDHNRDIWTKQSDEENSWAGVIPTERTGSEQCVKQSEKPVTDMRNPEHHGSPEVLSSIKFDKTPTMVGGEAGEVWQHLQHDCTLGGSGKGGGGGSH